jgi:hypothetical protein
MASIIQTEYEYSDEEIVLQILENAHPKYFYGYKKCDDSKLPFDPSNGVYFCKRRNASLPCETNELNDTFLALGWSVIKFVSDCYSCLSRLMMFVLPWSGQIPAGLMSG